MTRPIRSPRPRPRGADPLDGARFVVDGPTHGIRRLSGKRRLACRIGELSKIAAEPEVQRVSACSRGGGPAGGVFWPGPAGRVVLAAAANGRLGPGYPSRPY